MAGFGGFLKQMNDTIRYNRDLLGKIKHQPFAKREFKKPNGTKIKDTLKLNEPDRSLLLQFLAHENSKENRRQIRVLLLSVIIVLLLIIGIGPVLNFILDFLR